MEKGDKKNAILNDNLSVHINVRWLLQIVVATAMITFGWYKLEIRIQSLERNMDLALKEIKLHELERQEAERKHVDEMEERMGWYERELNLNPFSWGKNKRSK
tara:strand:+ start:210 stop:518 length:309 start_codon:yes stop_codon:yes gene_type:complete